MLEQPESAAGSKVACPQCSQRLQVPLPPTSKTILGDLVGNAPVGTAVEQAPAGSSAFDAQIRLVNGREIMSWYCPLCQSQVEVALDLGQKTIRCPHCAKKINVPEGPPANAAATGANPSPLPTAPYAPPVASAPASWLVPVPPPPPREPDEYIEPRSRRDYDDDPPSRGRDRSRRYGYDDDDDDYDLPRRPVRYKREYSTWSATAGFICSLLSIAILVLSFVLWIIVVDDRRGRFGNRNMDGMVFVFLLATVGSFVLGILGVVFGSRGLDGSNDHNRGMAVTGLVCGIVGLVLSVIFAIPFLLCGMLLWTFGGFR